MVGKPLIWVGTTLDRLREFPAAARREAGHQLHRVQLGLEPSDWKPMRAVGAGVMARRNLAEVAAAPAGGMRRSMGARKLRRSSGNVFRDLGFLAEEAENLRIRSELMARLVRVIDDRDLTQAEAARIFGVTQPRVSDLVRGKIELFSIDMLVTMLARAGLQVTVTTRVRKRVA